jgi:predicted DCC family thiol-disulfide oxidoreductase YuxK
MLKNPIILFDGVCNLCSWWVQFTIKRDSRGLFRYAALQSRTGQGLLAKHGICPQSSETLLLVDGGSAFTKSDAILRIVSCLPGMWRLAGLFYLIPRFLRNQAYDFIARNRYRWFGKHDACMVTTPDIVHRFLE